MPLYEYECKKCHHRFEKIQKFSDPHVKKCPECGGPVEPSDCQWEDLFLKQRAHLRELSSYKECGCEENEEFQALQEVASVGFVEPARRYQAASLSAGRPKGVIIPFQVRPCRSEGWIPPQDAHWHPSCAAE